ncbi:sulfurtransferase [Filobacillus milosensis]|uniref:thiosulfate sulfurtransferase n=1 Tax=Filobacillus milosensis TaxID=94137 RepID=A0A4Y8IXF4_9BACI|nr:sulfurtransferase [Filobacillus milosensis]TFB24055.1 sulfurtransferase [Filobacillus milosensis]
MNFKKIFWSIGILLLLLIAGCANTSSSDGSDKETYPNADLLVDTEWAKDHLEDESITFIDMRAEGFDQGHIPGAASYNWGQLVDPDFEVEGFLIGPEEFAGQMQKLGVNEDSTVVIYDDGNSLAAARLFYALEYYGHTDIKILDGGYTGWLNAGHDISTEKSSVAAGNFKAEANEDLQSSQQEVLDSLDSKDVVFLDTRSKEEYTGENLRAERGGHIPNAVHIEWKEAVTKNDAGVPKFKSFDELKEQFEEAGVTKDKKIVPYCQTNVRGAHSYFVLRLLGYDNVSPYEGSWAQWGNNPDTPIDG